jgi:hypothetical protein
MKTCDPIQQDWLSEESAEFICTVEVMPQTVNTSKPEAPLGVTMPLFVEPNQVEAPVVAVVPVSSASERAQLRRQLKGAWVAATPPLKAVDPVLEHLNSAMHLAESLRGPAKKCSYRQKKSTGVLICQHLVAALKLADTPSDGAKSQSTRNVQVSHLTRHSS